MTPEEARAMVERIKDRSFDDESAHSMEDELYHRLVKALVDLTSGEFVTYFDLVQLVDCAKIVLETEDIQFARWCA
jgi:hypothetical protein